MRSLFFTVLAAATVAAIATVACSDDDAPTNVAADGGGGSDGSSGGETPPPGTPGEEDGKKRFSPTGCALRGTGLQVAKQGKSNPTSNGGAAPWTNVEGAFSEDGQFASVTLEPGQESQQLFLWDYGFNLPLTPKKAEVWGIVVQLKRRSLNDASVSDIEINLVIDGVQPQGKRLAGEWPRGIVGTHDYGDRVETWMVDTKPEYFNDPNFATRLAIKRKADDAITGPQEAIVESIKVELWFCPDPDIKAN